MNGLKFCLGGKRIATVYAIYDILMKLHISPLFITKGLYIRRSEEGCDFMAGIQRLSQSNQAPSFGIHTAVN